MCVDLSHLNKHILCERYQSPTPAQAVADIGAREVQDIYNYGCFEGLPPVSIGSAKPTSDYLHYPIWEIQIPQGII